MIKRREFITLLGGAAAWPLAARAQQQAVSALRVGFVGIQPRDAPIYVAFRKRMSELGQPLGRPRSVEHQAQIVASDQVIDRFEGEPSDAA
jgi:putative ABC transport system substrate-binding protein